MKKEINVEFNHKAETTPEALGIEASRAREIANEMKDFAGSAENESEVVEHALSAYNDAEAVWALFLVQPAEQAAMVDELVAAQDDGPDESDIPSGF